MLRAPPPGDEINGIGAREHQPEHQESYRSQERARRHAAGSAIGTAHEPRSVIVREMRSVPRRSGRFQLEQGELALDVK